MVLPSPRDAGELPASGEEGNAAAGRAQIEFGERPTRGNEDTTPGEMTGMTTEPEPPSDADRIIAAQREEGRKTRTLLVWIFVGVPVLGLCIWGLVALTNSGATPSTTPNTIVSSTVTGGPLSLASTCQQLNDATTAQLHDFDEVNPEVADEASTNCTTHPDWTISQAIAPPTP